MVSGLVPVLPLPLGSGTVVLLLPDRRGYELVGNFV